MRLTKEQIIAANDRPTEEVEVPEWGGSVLVRGISASQRTKYEQALFKGFDADGKPIIDMNGVDQRLSLCALCIVDDSGAPLFSKEEVAVLGDKSGVALQRIFEVAQRLSGLGAGVAEATKGKSETTEDKGSSSVSA